MNSRLPLACIIAASCLLAETDHSMASENAGPTLHERLEIAARSFTNSGYFASSRELTEAIFGIPHYLRIPEPFQSVLKDKLQLAEDSYWRNEAPGLEERDLVNSLNSLVDELKLPDFAKTNQDQLRMLRMQLVVGLPNFMGRGLTDPKLKVGDNIHSSMSPLQALHLMLTLIDQKCNSETYQVSPEEWPEARRNYEAELRKRASSGRYSIRSISTARRLQLTQQLNSAVASLSYTDGLQMLTGFFSAFGIK